MPIYIYTHSCYTLKYFYYFGVAQYSSRYNNCTTFSKTVRNLPVPFLTSHMCNTATIATAA